MRFYQFEYKLKVVDKISGVVDVVPKREWFGSEREAVIRRLELFKSGQLVGKKKDNEIWGIDIPTDKQGLLAWLRSEC
jgi:hypothetical protein